MCTEWPACAQQGARGPSTCNRCVNARERSRRHAADVPCPKQLLYRLLRPRFVECCAVEGSGCRRLRLRLLNRLDVDLRKLAQLDLGLHTGPTSRVRPHLLSFTGQRMKNMAFGMGEGHARDITHGWQGTIESLPGSDLLGGCKWQIAIVPKRIIQRQPSLNRLCSSRHKQHEVPTSIILRCSAVFRRRWSST